MESKQPDRLNMGLLLMLAIVGAVLSAIALYRYYQ